ncbi:MAG: hypothetical protein ACF8OB_15635, partial [Phycisphaeraceae bacterium JB051]
MTKLGHSLGVALGMAALSFMPINTLWAQEAAENVEAAVEAQQNKPTEKPADEVEHVNRAAADKATQQAVEKTAAKPEAESEETQSTKPEKKSDPADELRDQAKLLTAKAQLRS